jgi:hypothetical protein
MASSSGGNAGGPWEHLFKHAKRLGLSGRNIILLVLTFFAFTALSAGASAYAVILLFIVAYGYDPVLEAVQARREKALSQLELDDAREELSSYARRKRRELSASEPELPLELPAPEREKK